MKLTAKTAIPTVNVALDTIEIGKQALVFVNSKRSAEKVAEDISKKKPLDSTELAKLCDGVLKVLSRPTKQCERLARCVKHGVAFHHSGLHSKQKDLVESAFKSGVIKVIACTPTLAAGLDMPAFRAIIRDVKRFGTRGMQHIPVLEFLQMAGRAGRPKYDKTGEVIVICATEGSKDHAIDHYLNGEPEDIYSKLAVEPVLRTYVLSLINSRIVKTHDQLVTFFSETFWAHQYEDAYRLEQIIDKVLDLLLEWEFLEEANGGYIATMLGKRITELYVDPLTAHEIIVGLEKGNTITLKAISFLQLVCNTLEMRPLLRVSRKEFQKIQDAYGRFEPYLMQCEPSMYEPEFDSWMKSVKTALMLQDWIDEQDEQWILDTYNCRPGEIRYKLNNADWLLYATHEIARLKNYQPILKEIVKLRLRVKYGVREELLPLIKLRGIGRARARKLFKFTIKNVGDIRRVSLEKLSSIIGKAVAKSLKEQIGQKTQTDFSQLVD